MGYNLVYFLKRWFGCYGENEGCLGGGGEISGETDVGVEGEGVFVWI